MRRHSGRGGFTLLEMAIVIVVIGLITGMSAFFGMGALESAKQAQTENKLQLIEDTLQAYREKNDRLPCPADAALATDDSNYGVEAATPGTCTGGTPAANYSTSAGIVEGALPVATLNLPDSFMYDGWGRKFAYAVNSNATALEGFRSINLGDSCGITIDDASANPRTTGAIYALVSYGKDGHGGYLANGTRYNAGATNGDELKNCHCKADGSNDTYAATYVQKDPIEGSATTTFDDIVRFRQRWQMQNYEDKYTPYYAGPQLMVGYQQSVGVSPSAYAYRMQCGKVKKQYEVSASESSATGVVFLPSNSAILVFSGPGGCELYPIKADGTLDTGSTVNNCPAYDASVKVALSENGYLAISQGAPPFVQIWKQSGNSFGSPLSETLGLGSAADSISIDDDLLVVSSNANNYITVFSRSGDTFTAIDSASQPGLSNPYSSAVSPNEMYVGATSDATSPPKLYLWRVNSALGLTALGAKDIGGASNNHPAGLTFSSDGRYIAVGGQNGNNVNIFKINSGDVITAMTVSGWTSGSSTAGTGFAFSSDSSYLAMLTPDGTKPLVLFRWKAANEFQYATVPDAGDFPNVSGVSGLSAAFSH